ncbi:hypothetical protein F5B20DRAFT_369672 [Whalleya microplaca]|nr:hypothetical protein F5B20DRAFT_369672 [Whalleya microplaca]
MRFNLTQALILGLLASEPLARVIQSRNNFDIRGLSSDSTKPDVGARDIVTAEGVDDAVERRKTWESLDTRGGGGGGKGKGGGGSGGKPVRGPRDPENIKDVQAKGKSYRNDLKHAIDTKPADTGKTEKVTGDPPGGLGYKEKTGPMEQSDRADLDFARELHIDGMKGEWKSRTIYSDELGKPSIETSANVEQKVTVVQHSYNRDYDTIKKANWVHMFYSNLKSFFGNNMHQLQYIIRDKIGSQQIQDSNGVTLNTQDAIEYAFQQMGHSTESTLHLDYASTNAKEQSVIDHLSAQTHVARVLQFLKDYRSQMGNKQISKLHLFHEEHPGTSAEYEIIIELTQ